MRRSFVTFSWIFRRFWSEKVGSEWKLIWYSESARKTEFIYVQFKRFLKLFFSSKICPYSPSGISQKLNFVEKALRHHKEVQKLFKIIILQNEAWPDDKYSFSNKFSFWLIPEGEYGQIFDEKKSFQNRLNCT